MAEQINRPVVVSVVMVTYNHRPYIRQALDSVLEQETTFPYEILVGDDASTDGTGEIVKEYIQRNPGIICGVIRESNLGPTKNIYDLLLRARGKYIANCEGDDYWTDRKKLQKQVEFLEKNSAYSACTHDCRIVDENGVPLSEQNLNWVSRKRVFTQNDFKGIYLPGQPTTWVHRNFLNDTNHDFSIIYKANGFVGDRTVTLILTMYGPIYHMDSVMSCYRKSRAVASKSVTEIVFARNRNVNRMQYEMTLTLEKYAHDEFDVSLRFTRFKMEQWIKMKIRELCSRILRKSGG